MNTYPEMDAKIVGILRLSDEPAHLYAAQRIAELEGALEAIGGAGPVVVAARAVIAETMRPGSRSVFTAEMVALQDALRAHDAME